MIAAVLRRLGLGAAGSRAPEEPFVRYRSGGRRARRARLSPVVLGCLAGAVVLLGGGWLWFRDSSYVAVKQVRITGVAGPDVSQIRQALGAAVANMTTLDIDASRLRAAVRAYPFVKSITVETQFPHGVVIHVGEEVPVAVVAAGDRRVAVDGAGVLLGPADGGAAGRLPAVPLAAAPGGGRVTAPGARAALAVLAAAPWRLLAHIAGATHSAGHGVIVQLRNGPRVFFGPAGGLAAKWAATVAALADPTAAAAAYIDVTDPERPVAGAETENVAGSTSPFGAG